MTLGGLRQHGKRAPQMHGRPVFTSVEPTPTPTPTLPTSRTDTMFRTSSTTSATASSTSTDVPHALFVYPTAKLTLNNIDVVQVSYRSTWNSVNLTVFCDMDSNSNEFALAKINRSTFTAQCRRWTAETDHETQYNRMAPTPLLPSKLGCRYLDFLPIVISCLGMRKTVQTLSPEQASPCPALKASRLLMP
jgi:hypothetical protein